MTARRLNVRFKTPLSSGVFIACFRLAIQKRCEGQVVHVRTRCPVIMYRGGPSPRENAHRSVIFSVLEAESSELSPINGGELLAVDYTDYLQYPCRAVLLE